MTVSALRKSVLNKDKKTHLIYLSKKKVDLAREYSENYQKLLAIVEEMTMLNMKLIKEGAIHQVELKRENF